MRQSKQATRGRNFILGISHGYRKAYFRRGRKKKSSYRGKVTRLQNDLKRVLEERDIAEEAFLASRNVVGITPYYIQYYDDLIDPSGISKNKKYIGINNKKTLKVLLAFGKEFHFNASIALEEIIRLMHTYEASFEDYNKRRFLLAFYHKEASGLPYSWPYLDPFNGIEGYYDGTDENKFTRISKQNTLESVNFIHKHIPLDKKEIYENELCNCRIVALQRHGVVCFINTIPKLPR